MSFITFDTIVNLADSSKFVTHNTRERLISVILSSEIPPLLIHEGWMSD
jgi:hypothetical protein